MIDIYNPNKLIINKNNIIENLTNLQEYIGKEVKIMPMIKANGYGLGTNNMIDIIKHMNIKQVGVSNIIEAAYVRGLYSEMIYVTIQPFMQQIKDIIKYNIVVSVFTIDFVEALNNESIKNNVISKVHIKVDTGMGRTGVKVNDLEEFLIKCKNFTNILVDGISTHLSSENSDENYTNEQISKFNQSVITAKKHYPNISYIHYANSGGSINYPNSCANLVRPGILMYGYYKTDKMNVLPSVTIKTKVVSINELLKNEASGYDQKIIADKNMKIAVIPMGYADILPSLKPGMLNVIINNNKYCIKAICMDVMLVDITNSTNISVGDDVTILDNNLITMEDITKTTNVISYNVLTNISNRVERILK